MPAVNCLTSYYSSIEGIVEVEHPSAEVIPWWVWAPPKAQGLGKALIRAHGQGRVQLRTIQGSNHAQLLEYYNLDTLTATRLPCNSVSEYQPGHPLPERRIGLVEASAIRESIRVAARPLISDIWSCAGSGFGSRIVVLKYIGGTLASAKSQPSFATLYPVFLSHVARGLNFVDATWQAHRQLLEPNYQPVGAPGSSATEPSASSQPGGGATAAVPTPNIHSAAAAPPAPTREGLTSKASGVPRRPALPRAVLTPVGKSPLPARPLIASAAQPQHASQPEEVDPHSVTCKTPESSDSDSASGVWKRAKEDRSRSPVRRRKVVPTGSVAGYIPAPVVGPVPPPPRPVAPPQRREYPHSFVRIAQAPAVHRR